MEQIAETVRTEPEAELVERLRRRERDAAEALVTAYGDRVYRLALRITGNPSDAEEVVQDAFWTVTRKIDTFRGDAAFGSWLYRITANAAYQKLRRPRSERNEVPWESVGAPGDDRGPQQAPLADWSAGGEDVALQAEQRRILETAIGELPANHRATFLLHDVEGLSNPEIAQTLHLKVATVKSRVHRARLFLRGRLTEYMTDTPRPVSEGAHSGRAMVSKWCRDLAHMMMPVNRRRASARAPRPAGPVVPFPVGRYGSGALFAHGSPRG
jgi:RNA polymerase sigma-70 factor (ECF subfamily)